METIVDMHLETLMGENFPYKEVYSGVKNLIQSILTKVLFVGLIFIPAITKDFSR